MVTLEQDKNISHKYISYLKHETGLLINESDILEKITALSKYKNDENKFLDQYKNIYKDLLKTVAPQIIKSNLEKGFDGQGNENQTDLEHFYLNVKRVDKAMMGMLINTCFDKDKDINVSKYVLGGMNSKEFMESLGYENMSATSRKDLLEVYLKEHPTQNKIELHRERLENASMNSYAYIKKQARVNKLDKNQIKNLANDLTSSLSPLYQKVNEEQNKMSPLSRQFSSSSRLNKEAMNSLEENLFNLTGQSKEEIKKNLLKESSNEIKDTMDKVKERFISEDLAYKIKLSFEKEYDIYRDSIDLKSNLDNNKIKRVTIDLQDDQKENEIVNELDNSKQIEKEIEINK